MGRFVNPDNTTFKTALNTKIYVDKTKLIEFTNSLICTTEKFICNSRPRRLGKSYTANMLAAYYSKGCNSQELFTGLAIAESPTYHKYLNKMDVIHFDLQWFFTKENVNQTIALINAAILAELREIYPNELTAAIKTIPDALSKINAATGNQFVIIIDEWDMLIRDAAQNMEYYFKPIRELPTGRGFADFVYIPKKQYAQDYPALLVELKWNQKAETGIRQIKERKYPQSLQDFADDILLVGISYDKNTKEHTCCIEKFKK